jgi:hypothetical protein
MTIDQIRVRWGALAPDEASSLLWQATLWVPVGYASSRLFGEAVPALTLAVLAGLLAGVHRMAPGAVELAVAGGALAGGVVVASNDDCHVLVGDSGVAVLVAFGGGMLTWAVVRLLGSASVREAAYRLIVATMALELALSGVTPVGEAGGLSGTTATTVVLGTLLVLVTLFGVHAGLGPPVLAVALLGVQGALALTGGPCHTAAAHALLGTAVFVAVAVALRTRPLPFGYDPVDQPGGDEDGDAGSEPWVTSYDEHGPVRSFRVPELDEEYDTPGPTPADPGDGT